MSKKRNLSVASIGFSIFALLLLYSWLGNNESILERKNKSKQVASTEQNLITKEAKHSVSLKEPDGSFNALQHQLDNPVKTKIAYDDDWCIAAIDLSEQDQAYYSRELEDWNITQGNIPLPLPSRAGSRVSQHIAPYMESSYDVVWQQIQNDNTFAMIAALNRDDFGIESRRQIAGKLLIKGHTAIALTRLSTFELVRAQTLFQRTGQIDADIEAHLHRAMAYIAYGISQNDLSATQLYLLSVSLDDFPLELRPRYAIGTDNRIQEHVDSLTQWVDEERAHENLQLPTTDEFPKAAKHDFESRLARLHLEYGKELNDLKGVLPETTSTLLEGSECVQRQVTFFGDLERRARSRVR